MCTTVARTSRDRAGGMAVTSTVAVKTLREDTTLAQRCKSGRVGRKGVVVIIIVIICSALSCLACVLYHRQSCSV